MARHDKDHKKHDDKHGAKSARGQHENEGGKPKDEQAEAGMVETMKDKVAEVGQGAMDSARGVLENEKIRATLDKGGQALSDAGEMLADTGRSAMDAGRNLLSGIMDMSVLLGMAAGFGVWYFMHGGADSNSGDIEIKTGGMAKSVADGAGSIVGSVSESASNLSNNAMQKMQGVMAEVQGAVDRNPWVFVAGGLLVGSLLAVLIPQTEPENRLLGEMRDQVVDQASETLQTTVKDTLQTGMMQTAVEVVKSSLNG